MDDAFITFRYAANLAEHGEFTYNVGEDPVEGYTGVLFPLTLAGLIRLGIDPVLSSRIIGIGSFYVGGAIILAFFLKLGVRSIVWVLMLALYFLAPAMLLHSFMGLETVLFSTIVLACAFALFCCLEADKGSVTWEIGYVSLLLLAGLTRPEGVVFAVVSAVAVIVFSMRVKDRSVRRFVTVFLLLYVIPGLIYFGWRWHYYGQLLPNTYYIKGYAGILSPSSIKTFAAFGFLYLLMPTLAGLLLILSNPREGWTGLKERKVLPSAGRFGVVLASIVAFELITLAQYFVSTLITNVAFRFYVFFFPLSIVVIGAIFEIGFYAVSRPRPENRSNWTFRLTSTAAGLMLAAQLVLYVFMLRGDMKYSQWHHGFKENAAKPAARFLRSHVPHTGRLVVHFDAGAVPYYSGLKTVDFGGLNDEFLSRKNRMPLKDRVEYFYSVKPEAVVFTSYSWNRVNHGDEAEAIVNDERFQDYEPVKKFGNPRDKFTWDPLYFFTRRVSTEYHYIVFLRKDIARAGAGINVDKPSKRLGGQASVTEVAPKR